MEIEDDEYEKEHNISNKQPTDIHEVKSLREKKKSSSLKSSGIRKTAVSFLLDTRLSHI